MCMGKNILGWQFDGYLMVCGLWCFFVNLNFCGTRHHGSQAMLYPGHILRISESHGRLGLRRLKQRPRAHGQGGLMRHWMDSDLMKGNMSHELQSVPNPNSGQPRLSDFCCHANHESSSEHQCLQCRDWCLWKEWSMAICSKVVWGHALCKSSAWYHKLQRPNERLWEGRSMAACVANLCFHGWSSGSAQSHKLQLNHQFIG